MLLTLTSQTPSQATLCVDRGARQVTYAELAAFPTPPATATFQPVAHRDFVATLWGALSAQGVQVSRTELAVSHDGQKLFGTMLLTQETTEWAAALGFRASNDKTLALQLLAGVRVFVCSNLCLSGDTIVLRRKHTAGLRLQEEVVRGLGRYVQHQQVVEQRLTALHHHPMSPMAVRLLLSKVFETRVLPIRLFHPVHQAYFAPEPGWHDCQPRTRWGVYSACTRAVAQLPLRAGYDATVRLGRFFGL